MGAVSLRALKIVIMDLLLAPDEYASELRPREDGREKHRYRLSNGFDVL